MKIKKSLLVFALILAIVMLNACGSAKDKVIEKAAEKAVEKASGSKIDVKKDGVKVSNESGTYESGNNLKWPADKMGDLPQPKGKITAVLSDDKSKGCTVGYSGCELKDAQDYVNALKKLGYGNGTELTDKDGMMFGGQKSDGSTVNFTYNAGPKEGAISYVKESTQGSGQTGAQTAAPGTTPGSSASSTDNKQPAQGSQVDMTDVAPWPKDFIKGVPELKGKIVNVETSNDIKKNIYLEYVEKADVEKYIETLKNNGYTVDKDESSSIDNIYFAGYNEKGDWVEVSWYGGKTANVVMEKVE